MLEIELQRPRVFSFWRFALLYERPASVPGRLLKTANSNRAFTHKGPSPHLQGVSWRPGTRLLQENGEKAIAELFDRSFA